MMDCSFSRCKVRSLPEPGPWNDSRDEKLEGRLPYEPGSAACWPGDTEREAAAEFAFLVLWRSRRSSAEERVGEERPGEREITSSASDTWALSREAAKLLEMSGSEM